MPTTDQIEFRKVRDFGDVINVTFAFLRQNYALLGKSLLFIAGPAALLAGLGSLSWFDEASFVMVPGQTPDDEILAEMFGFSYFLLLLASLLTGVLAVTVVNVYIVLYQEKGFGNFDVDHVWALVKERFGSMLGVSVFAFFLYFGSIFIMILPTSLLMLGGSAAGLAVGAVVLMFSMIAWMVLFFYFLAVIAMLFPIRMFESQGIFDTLRRSRYLIKGNYGNTFAVLMVSVILMTILGLMFSIPSYIMTFLGGFHAGDGSGIVWWKYLLAVGSVIGAVGTSILYAIPTTATSFQYYCLVEKKESTGLMQRIQDLDDAQEKKDDDLF